jgi:hypothetical protein
MSAPRRQGTIRVRRASALWRDRLSAYYIHVDGHRVAAVRQGLSVDVTVDPGEHTLRLTSRSRLFHSKEVNFSVSAGQLLEFSCEPGGPAIESVLVMLRPHRYIRLQGPDPNWPAPPEVGYVRT